LRKLYKNFDVPEFALRAIPAWISIWPNRPHDDWTCTFERMCEALDAEYGKRPFDTFVASCGCYGLPICDYARVEHGCRVLYLGNYSHAFFGVMQNATRDFMKGHLNPEMWVQSDLARFPNLARIEHGRYVFTQ
jgi:hypothetical protein